MPVDQGLDCRQQHPIPDVSRIVIWVRRQHRILDIGNAATQEFSFVFQYAGIPYRRRRDSLRNSWQTIATAYGFHKGWSEFVYPRRGRAGRPITTQRGSLGLRFGDIGVVLVSGGDHDGPQQVHHVRISPAHCWLEQGHVGGQSHVRRNPSAGEVGD